MKSFEKLLEPYHIGSVKPRNRIIKTDEGLLITTKGGEKQTLQADSIIEGFTQGDVL
jgi:hypothetical protein